MMNYLFGLIDAPAACLDGLAGWGGAPLQVLPFREMGAVVCAVETADLEASEANLWRHEAVLESLMGRHALLPVRFGVYFRAETAVTSWLASRYEGLLANFARVDGCVELSLRLMGDLPKVATPLPAARSGRDYLRARLAQERSSEAQKEAASLLFAGLDERLAPLVVEREVSLFKQPLVPITAVLLVRREQVEQVRTVVGEYGRLHPRLQLLCTGPWPPYHFVQTTHERNSTATA